MRYYYNNEKQTTKEEGKKLTDKSGLSYSDKEIKFKKKKNAK